MCGIAGIFIHSHQEAKNLAFEPKDAITKMADSLRHRGPEKVSTWSSANEKCWLGHARLRVTDNSEQADQPFTTKSGKTTLVFNGEIYNSGDIVNACMRWLKNNSRTKSDTEVLAEAIEMLNEDVFYNIEGMFAFGAYNEEKQELTLARDRFGQKPLYFISNAKFTAFASELRALKHVSEGNWQVDDQSAATYMRHRYIHAPKTAIKSVSKLEPSQIITIKSDGRISKDRFFFPECKPTLPCNLRLKKLDELIRTHPIKTVEELIKRSVKRSITDDAAVIISGGIDSTLVSSVIKELDDEKYGKDKKKRKAFTIQLPHQPKIEVEWAKKLCRHWGWEHHVVEVDERHLVNSYLLLTQHLDEPNGDRSLLPTHLLAQIISPYTRVAIGGDGGDELFCGYSRYLQFGSLLQKHQNGNWGNIYWSNALKVGDLKAVEQVNQIMSCSTDTKSTNIPKILQSQWSHEPLNFLRILDINYYLPLVLDKVDKTSMFYGLEVRSPLLDTKVAMAALSISPSLHTKQGETKAVLKEVLRKRLGSLPKGAKQGFGAMIEKDGMFESFLRERISKKMKEINESNRKKAHWIRQYINIRKSDTMRGNELFATAIYLEWASNCG